MQRVSEIADRIEAAMKESGAWQNEPLAAEAYDFRAAFGADTMAFTQWIQFVLLARIRQIAAGQGQLPGRSEVGAYAVRELDGSGWERLTPLLGELDDVINRSRR
jgi:uncharacterized protein YqcC (DUF446 family)